LSPTEASNSEKQKFMTIRVGQELSSLKHSTENTSSYKSLSYGGFSLNNKILQLAC
jgi:hypothetical protein